MRTFSFTHNLLAVNLLHQFRNHLDELVMPRRLAVVDPEYSDLLFYNDYNVSFMSEEVILRGDVSSASSLFLSILYHLMGNRQEEMLKERYKKDFPASTFSLDGYFFLFEDTIDWMIAQLHASSQPYLAYFHFLPPHSPYNPRHDYLGKFDDNYSPVEKPESFATEGFKKAALKRNRQRYDEYLAYTDYEFGRLLTAMEESGMLANTYVILTADHGELFERGIRGHLTPVMYEPIVHIPLVIWRPGGAEREDIHTPTNCVDLLATIQHIYGQPTPEWCEGQVLPTFGVPAGERPIFVVDSRDTGMYAPMKQGSFMVMRGDYKLVHYTGVQGESVVADELYDLASDPEELDNLAGKKPATVAELMDDLNAKLQTG